MTKEYKRDLYYALTKRKQPSRVVFECKCVAGVAKVKV